MNSGKENNSDSGNAEESRNNNDDKGEKDSEKPKLVEDGSDEGLNFVQHQRVPDCSGRIKSLGDWVMTVTDIIVQILELHMFFISWVEIIVKRRTFVSTGFYLE